MWELRRVHSVMLRHPPPSPPPPLPAHARTFSTTTRCRARVRRCGCTRPSPGGILQRPWRGVHRAAAVVRARAVRTAPRRSARRAVRWVQRPAARRPPAVAIWPSARRAGRWIRRPAARRARVRCAANWPFVRWLRATPAGGTALVRRVQRAAAQQWRVQRAAAQQRRILPARTPRPTAQLRAAAALVRRTAARPAAWPGGVLCGCAAFAAPACPLRRPAADRVGPP
jgi:hypothetical protein